MAKKTGFDTTKIEKTFQKSIDFKRMVLLGTHAFEPLLTGGFKRKVAAGQSKWKTLQPRYLRTKAKRGFSANIWERTGRTAKALNSGRPKPRKTSTTKGMKFVLNKGYKAYLELRSIGGKGRAKKDAFYTANATRPLFSWESTDKLELEKGLEKGFEVIWTNAVKEVK